MKWIINIALLLLATVEARADLPPKNYPYTLRSANNEFYLRSIPYSLGGTLGKSYVHNSKTGQLLYSIDRFFPDIIFLSDDGQCITSVSHWGAHNIAVDDSIHGYAIDFYRQTENIRTYEITDLVKNKSRLIYSVSHVQWRYNLFKESYIDKESKFSVYPTDSLRTRMDRHSTYASNDTLYVTTVEKKVLVFYIPTGKMVKSRHASKFFEAKGNYSFPISRKEKLPDFKELPRDLPPLAKGEGDLSYALAYLLNYKRASEGNHSNAIITIKLVLDRETSTVEILDVDVNERDNDSNAIKQKILDWLKDKRFQTGELAPWVEKWYYYKEYYFTYQ
ncbi:MAG: hypothetical protein HOP10_05950 [Chitinophagaceae bacterium]|nr:hypothetical protein [Chitinophagaceae bacterium]